MDAENLITVSTTKAAAMSGLSKRTIQYYLETGLLNSIRIGKRRLIKVRDLEKFLATDRPAAGAARQANARTQ